MKYDLVIRNGTVVDGSGLASYRADVGVAGGRIAAIGRIRDKGAEEVETLVQDAQAPAPPEKK